MLNTKFFYIYGWKKRYVLSVFAFLYIYHLIIKSVRKVPKSERLPLTFKAAQRYNKI